MPALQLVTDAGPPTRPGWDEALAAWEEQMRTRHRARRTITENARYVRWLVDAFPDPWAVSATELARWVDEHPAMTPANRRKFALAVRQFYALGIYRGWIDRSPVIGLSSAPAPTTGPQSLILPAEWLSAAREWRGWLVAGGRQPGTIRLRMTQLHGLSECFADPWALTTDDLAAYLARDDWAIDTRRSVLACVRSFYTWAERAGYVDRSPARDLPSIRSRRAVPRPAPDVAVTQALQGADDRMRLAVLLALLAGLRRAEIAGLHTRDIQPGGVTVKGKGGHERTVPLHPYLDEALRRELELRRARAPRPGWPGPPPLPDGWLFPSVGDQSRPLTASYMGVLIAEVLPGGWTAHTLRHAFATAAYASVRDLRAVQELLGHTSPATTARYVQVPTDALWAAVSGIRSPGPAAFDPPGGPNLAGGDAY